jgi:ABC-type transporter Mla subunit MlaD
LLALTGFFIGLLALLTGFAFWLARVQGRAAKKSRRARRK